MKKLMSLKDLESLGREDAVEGALQYSYAKAQQTHRALSITLSLQPSGCITHVPCSHPAQKPAQRNAKCPEVLQCPGSVRQFSSTNGSFCREGETLFLQPAWGRGTAGTELQVGRYRSAHLPYGTACCPKANARTEHRKYSKIYR